MAEKTPEIPLGKDTEYPRAFDSSLLFAIPRAPARSGLGIGEGTEQELPFAGYDEWTLYELSWLDKNGSPQVAIGLLKVPADSTSIVESKSLKLYANGLFYKRFNSPEDVINQVTGDLNRILNCVVQFSLIGLNGSHGQKALGSYQSLDHYRVDPTAEPDVSQLLGRIVDGEFRYQTERFRSLCPVTGQPDWASIYIRLKGVEVDAKLLSQYLASFSEHQGFHENCVERIYIELQSQLEPAGISVAARYTRRGGIDINPVRASSDSFLEMPGRELRQ